MTHRIIKKLFLPALLLWSAAGAQAQQTVAGLPATPYQVGEKLTYSASYSLSFINTDVGEVIFSVTSGKLNGKPVYHFNATAVTYPFYRTFFDMRDVYDSWVDQETLKPLYMKSNIKEGGYRFTSEVNYDWVQMRGYSKWRNLKRPSYTHKVLPLTSGCMDGVSLFYSLRSIDASAMSPGQRGQVELLLEDTVRKINYRFIGRETRAIAGLGTCKTMKFSAELATSTGEAFADGTEFFIWFSDDKNQIPLYVETPIRVGSVKVRLIKWEALRYPFASKQ
ncbi:MAG: DUF3108 domain-containing protein [Rikenellaceae bacterium]|jgi:hypothetical protein|nr:DUF3108 domain-containing protein [Rikenellaceae bacterium]